MRVMDWIAKTFEQLTSHELYQLLRARVDVFVVEQQCAYREIDDVDQASIHLFLEDKGEILAYARIIPKGVLYYRMSIGRILVPQAYRGNDYGRQLLTTAIDWIEHNWEKQEIMLHAQVYLRDFYQSFGFEVVTDVYLEDGIPHVDMVRPVSVS